MNQIILTGTSASRLNEKIQQKIDEGFKPVGSHTVITVHSQNVFSGSQHHRTEHSYEYAQTMLLDLDNEVK